MKRSWFHMVLAVGSLGMLAGCGEPASKDAEANAGSAVEAPGPEAAWPASLKVVGDGFPKAGDPCRRIGESEATVDFLDDSASLVGCKSAEDAARLGGKVVGTVDGVTLVSVPSGPATAGDGDSQGDAMVAGTSYNATAQIPCSGYKGAAPGRCDAGVVRSADTGPYVEVKLADGTTRTIMFEKSGKFLTFSTAQSDGTAAMKISSRREGDTTIAMLGGERYDIPDVLILGD